MLKCILPSKIQHQNFFMIVILPFTGISSKRNYIIFIILQLVSLYIKEHKIIVLDYCDNVNLQIKTANLYLFILVSFIEFLFIEINGYYNPNHSEAIQYVSGVEHISTSYFKIKVPKNHLNLN